jgi:DNA adenine methylase
MMTQILKWPGSKRARAAQLAGYFGDDARPVYCEPFLGTASIYGFGISRGIAVLGDAAPRLIPTYRALRKDPGEVARALAALPATVGDAGNVAVDRGWVAPADDKRAGLYADPWNAYFYHHRTSLNAWVPVFGEVATPERAAAFIWHRMAGFNGLMRVGPGGDNTPAGDGVSLPGRQELIEFGAGLAGALLVETDFEATINAALSLGPVDLMLDPPYSGDFSGYTPSGFGDSDRDRLAACARRVVEGGGRVVVTESDHPEARRWLAAAGLHVREAQGRTSISRSGAQRGAKPELVARSWPW